MVSNPPEHKTSAVSHAVFHDHNTHVSRLARVAGNSRPHGHVIPDRKSMVRVVSAPWIHKRQRWARKGHGIISYQRPGVPEFPLTGRSSDRCSVCLHPAAVPVLGMTCFGEQGRPPVAKKNTQNNPPVDPHSGFWPTGGLILGIAIGSSGTRSESSDCVTTVYTTVVVSTLYVYAYVQCQCWGF